uniref:Multiple epidermal growth factor-like domains protein 10 n=1 Tax=Crassostrea virginica TaxID=6565 RepID=A0A8B8ESE9_CRAVI|nr:multiple epidermal growth factor-like domains protein 10 [Crassostrea virginica]
MEFILLFLFTLVSTCNSLAGDNVCSRGYQNESGEFVKDVFCCKDYQEKNSMCVECDPGFRGYNCNQTCPDGYYGGKCLPKCKCNGSQFCHHVCGCLQRSNTTDNITTNSTEVVFSYSVETCFSSTDTSTDSTEVTQTARPNQEVTQTARPNQDSSNKGLFSNLYFTVTMSGIVLVLIIVVGLLSCFCSRKNRSASVNHHNPVYGEEERNINMDSHTGPDASGEALYGTCDRECYSTLALRVNVESVRPLDETSEVTHVAETLYAPVVKCKREDGC